MLLKSYIKAERLTVAFFLLFFSINLGHDVSAGWNDLLQEYAARPPAPGVPFNSLFQTPKILHAPEAYRIAIPALGRQLLRIIPHATEPRIAGLLDFTFCFLALWLFYLLLLEDLSGPEAFSRRLPTVLAFLALVPFALYWVTYFQRPETLPTTCFLAVTMLALRKRENKRGWLMILGLSSLWQGFVRADVAIVVGATLVILTFLDSPLELLGSRRMNLVRGMLIFLTAGCIHFYLQFIRFPEVHYWSGYPIVGVARNFHPHELTIAVRAMLPFLILLIVFTKQRSLWNNTNLLLMVCSIFFLPLWFIVGHSEEVRIFVPFLIAWCVLCAQGLGFCLTWNSNWLAGLDDLEMPLPAKDR